MDEQSRRISEFEDVFRSTIPALRNPSDAFVLRFGQNTFEQQILANNLIGILKAISRIPEPWRHFYIRVLYVPNYCDFVLRHLNNPAELKYGFHYCYGLAQQRMYLEFSLTLWWKSPQGKEVASKQGALRNRSGFKKLLRERLDDHYQRVLSGSNSPLDAFMDSGESPIYWFKRFDQYLLFAKKSLFLFLKKQSYRIKWSDPKPQTAEVVELLNTCWDPSGTGPDCRVWKNPELDSWLLEVWPIVRRFRWTHYDISSVFQCYHDPPKPISASAIRERCKKELGLKLNKPRRGKPKGLEEHKGKLPPFSDLGKLRSLGMKPSDWFTTLEKLK